MDASKASSLAPSKSTVYISNLPFSLTNSDLHKIFEKHGKIARVTIVKDKTTRKSKGVAFLLFLGKEAALTCVRETHGKEMFGRTLKSNIAKDNGRATEFIRRREYPDKSRCYECGEFGHLSYICPQNYLGSRPRPAKKKKKVKQCSKSQKGQQTIQAHEDSESDDDADFEVDTLGAAIRYQQELREGEEFLRGHKRPGEGTSESQHKKRVVKSSYFSDEEELSE